MNAQTDYSVYDGDALALLWVCYFMSYCRRNTPEEHERLLELMAAIDNEEARRKQEAENRRFGAFWRR